VEDPESASLQIHALFFGELQPVLNATKTVTTLLIAADRGLQAVPFVALHDGEQFLGDRYVFAITTSLALTEFDAKPHSQGRIWPWVPSSFRVLQPSRWSAGGQSYCL
jgi:CHAT domain-containing protein